MKRDHLKTLAMGAATPRFSTLTICIRGALRGWGDVTVQHMLSRNREVEMMRALLRVETVRA